MHVAKWSSHRDRVASLTFKLKCKNIEWQNMPSVVTKVARLWQDLAKVGKGIKNRGVELASSKDVGDEIAAIKKEIASSVMFVTLELEHVLSQDALTREREAEIKLS